MRDTDDAIEALRRFADALQSLAPPEVMVSVPREKQYSRFWKALEWRWGSGMVTLDCDDKGYFRIYVDHAEAHDECYLGRSMEDALQKAIDAEVAAAEGEK
jgi:hypothetical protein